MSYSPSCFSFGGFRAQELAADTDSADAQQPSRPQPPSEQPSEHGHECETEPGSINDERDRGGGSEGESEKGEREQGQKTQKRGFFGRRSKAKKKGSKVQPARPT